MSEMSEYLPTFVLNELQLYISDFEEGFFKYLNQILEGESNQAKIRKLLVQHLKNLKVSKFEVKNQYILLSALLMCYWSKDYETNLYIYNKFKEKIDSTNLSIQSCYLLSLRDLFLIDEFERTRDSILELTENISEKKQKEFVILSIGEFSARTQKRPEIGYKALNELLRYLIEIDDLASQFPFILDALLTDLVNFAYALADDTLKDLWIDSAIKRAQNYENFGMLSSLYNLLISLSLKEYNLQQAEENFEEGKNYALKIGSERLQAILELSSAEMNKMKGEQDKALEIYQTLLDKSEISTPMQIEIYERMGNIYLLNDELVKADEYYTKAHNLNKEHGFLFPMIEIVYGYINFLKEDDKGESLEFGLQLAEEQFDFNSMPYYYFYKGLYHQKNVDLATAVGFFEHALEFFENQMIFEGILYTYAALADSYFEMFRITENNKFATQFLYFIDNLLGVTEELEHSIFVDAIITKAGYYQYRNMEEEANKTLKIGIDFAERNKLDDRIDELTIGLEEKNALVQELRGSRRLFSRIMKYSFGTHKKIPIILYLLLVIDEGGLPYYSYNFSEKEQIDDLLISGLITAIISFSEEVLGKGVETLRSITHQGRAVIIEQQDNIMAVLVAEDETFESRLQVRKFLKEAVRQIRNKMNKELVKREEFQPLVESIFNASPFTLEK